MRRLGLLALGVLCGALAVSGQDEGRGDALAQEIDRLKKLLAERIEARTPPADEEIVPATYDVADLCTSIEDHPQPLEDLHRAPEEAERPEPTRLVEVDFLIEMIRIGIEPQSWEIDGTSIEPKNGRILVRTLPRVHRKIERMLAWCRKSVDRRISVEVAFVPVRDVDEAILAGTADLTAEEAERLTARAFGAVTLAGWDGRTLGARTGRETTYIEDFDVEVVEGTSIPVPITRKAFAGCSAQVQVCFDDRQGAIVECRAEYSRVPEPIPVHATPHGNIELPRKQLTRVLSSFWAPFGLTVVAGGCTAGDDPCAILVTVRRK